MSESYYKYHVFFCTNKREDGKSCCQDYNADAVREFAKGVIKSQGLQKKGGVRINSAGCLNRCAEGPALVVYPDATWYTYVDQEDVEEIIESHLKGGKLVERLLLPK